MTRLTWRELTIDVDFVDGLTDEGFEDGLRDNVVANNDINLKGCTVVVYEEATPITDILGTKEEIAA